MEPEQPHVVSAEDDDDNAGDPRQHILITEQQAADGRGRGAQGHEHGGEAENKGQGRAQNLSAGKALPGILSGQVLQGLSGDVTQIGRHQGQHAGREKADQAAARRRQVGNFKSRHAFRVLPTQMEPFDRSKFVPWQGAFRLAMRGIA
jgi:hypothetical protein